MVEIYSWAVFNYKIPTNSLFEYGVTAQTTNSNWKRKQTSVLWMESRLKRRQRPLNLQNATTSSTNLLEAVYYIYKRARLNIEWVVSIYLFQFIL